MNIYPGRPKPDTMAQLELYELPCCPHCESVRSALTERGVEYDATTVPRSHGKRGELAERTGQTCVPVLIDHERDVELTPRDGDLAAYVEEFYRETPVASE